MRRAKCLNHHAGPCYGHCRVAKICQSADFRRRGGELPERRVDSPGSSGSRASRLAPRSPANSCPSPARASRTVQPEVSTSRNPKRDRWLDPVDDFVDEIGLDLSLDLDGVFFEFRSGWKVSTTSHASRAFSNTNSSVEVPTIVAFDDLKPGWPLSFARLSFSRAISAARNIRNSPSVHNGFLP